MYVDWISDPMNSIRNRCCSTVQHSESYNANSTMISNSESASNSRPSAQAVNRWQSLWRDQGPKNARSCTPSRQGRKGREGVWFVGYFCRSVSRRLVGFDPADVCLELFVASGCMWWLRMSSPAELLWWFSCGSIVRERVSRGSAVVLYLLIQYARVKVRQQA